MRPTSTAITTCGKDAKTGNFTVSTILFTWDSSYGSTGIIFRQMECQRNRCRKGRTKRRGNYSTVLPSYMTNDNTPYHITQPINGHVRTHDTGNCLFGCDATTNAPQSVTSEDCTAQPLPSDTYDWIPPATGLASNIRRRSGIYKHSRMSSLSCLRWAASWL